MVIVVAEELMKLIDLDFDALIAPFEAQSFEALDEDFELYLSFNLEEELEVNLVQAYDLKALDWKKAPLSQRGWMVHFIFIEEIESIVR